MQCVNRKMAEGDTIEPIYGMSACAMGDYTEPNG
jgi:hypothetical protein